MSDNKEFKSSPEMRKLVKLLDEAKIPYEKNVDFDNCLQLIYPNQEQRISDVICNNYSYGHEKGLLEIMGLVDIDKVGDSVEGHLTAADVFSRWQEHYLTVK